MGAPFGRPLVAHIEPFVAYQRAFLASPGTVLGRQAHFGPLMAPAQSFMAPVIALVAPLGAFVAHKRA